MDMGKTFACVPPKFPGVDWEWVGRGTSPVLVILPIGLTDLEIKLIWYTFGMLYRYTFWV